MVVVVPVPVVVVPPGDLVKVHVPVGGKLFSTTLPVATVQVGCVIVPTVGAGSVLTVIAKSIAVLVPQLEVPVTCKFPEVAEGGKVIVILLVLPGGVMVAPVPL
jgi:hypothetical protein